MSQILGIAPHNWGMGLNPSEKHAERGALEVIHGVGGNVPTYGLRVEMNTAAMMILRKRHSAL